LGGNVNARICCELLQALVTATKQSGFEADPRYFLLQKEMNISATSPIAQKARQIKEESDSSSSACGKAHKACGKLSVSCGNPVETLWNSWGKLRFTLRIANTQKLYFGDIEIHRPIS
jgi:hypothetical protein